MYEYFISFSYVDKQRSTGIGSTTVTRQGPIVTHADLIEVTEAVQAASDYAAVAIVNWQRYDEPPPPTTREERVEALRDHIRGLDITFPEAILLKSYIDECTIVFGGPQATPTSPRYDCGVLDE